MTDRSKTLEAMARAICGKNCDAPRCSCQTNKTTQRTCWEISLKGAEAALTAYESHIQASGMAVVPVEPTARMILAGATAKPLATHMNTLTAAGVWAAMLAAANPPQEKDDE